MNLSEKPEEELIAERFGEPVSIGHSTARNLREGGLDKFKGQGRRYARRDPHHRNNLSLGLVGDPGSGERRPVKSADYVRKWRSLRLAGLWNVERALEQREAGALTLVKRKVPITPADMADDPIAPVIDGEPNLGEAMDRFVPWLVVQAIPFGGIRNRPAGWADNVSILFEHGANPAATIRLGPPIGHGLNVRFMKPVAECVAPRSGLRRTTEITSEILMLLAEVAELDQTQGKPIVGYWQAEL